MRLLRPVTLLALSALSPAKLLDPLYKRLPIGLVKPSGWALNQARIQADSFAGHQADWYPYVIGSIWTGGTMEYSEMHEASPYWFNGAVALAFQLQDARLIGQVRKWLDYVLSHQQSDGWLGPEPYDPNATVPRLVWPRYLVLLGLVQYAEGDPSQTTRIVDAIHKFTDLVYTIWRDNKQGDPSMGFQFDYQYVRWEELVYSLQWLYDNHPRGKEAQLEETMKFVKSRGYNWKNDFFTDAAFPKSVVTQYRMPTHGVNIAEALKSEALSYRFTQDRTDVDSTFKRLELLKTYHGRASGVFAADEHLSGLSPARGTETCVVVEHMFSLATIYQQFGNNSIGDMVEKLAYNALPSALTPDMNGHQYDQQVNQIWAKNITGETPYGYNSGYSNVFGIEPNYPCCTTNFPQGFPKFWAHSFFSDATGSRLVHAFLGPASFSGKVGTNTITVNVATIYPFGSTLKYTVTASQALSFNIRIPEWAKGRAGSRITIGSGQPTALTPDSRSLQAVQILANSPTTITVNLDMPLQVETLKHNGAVVINRGPLNYAVQLAHNVTETLAWRNPQAANDAKRLFPSSPAEYYTQWISQGRDWVYQPTTDWRLAIRPSSIHVVDSSANANIPYQAWAPGAQPVKMTAHACRIEWGLLKGTAAPPPQSPVPCVGGIFNVTLVPFGAAKLRLGEVPVMA